MHMETQLFLDQNFSRVILQTLKKKLHCIISYLNT